MKQQNIFLSACFIGLSVLVTLLPQQATAQAAFSTAGFYEQKGSGRSVYNFNAGWRFYKGDNKNASQVQFNDAQWNVVNLPNGIELLPVEASGGKNYQGKVWYRKHFKLPAQMKGKKISLYFEAIMGKSQIFVNGKLAASHFGGYLPVRVELNDFPLSFTGDNVVSVMADNSDDPLFPPGKPQASLDFSYFGGIYRDVWLVATNTVHITDANTANIVAGGGTFIHSENVTAEKADVLIQTNLVNQSNENRQLRITTSIINEAEKVVQEATQAFEIEKGLNQTIVQKLTVTNPVLWSPDAPYLYKVQITVKDKNGEPVDGYYQKLGIRSIEFKGKEGFYLNGKYFNDKLVGTNRHQDFAYLGYAMPNSLHWRDAKKLRDAGIRIIRSHYPQDPAFMDACDELGLFVIVSAAGWQFWNNDSLFVNRCYADTRNMVRRDRNHASVIMWEPILNETHYPDWFAKNVYRMVHEEYPFAGCYAACDISTKGYEVYDVLYSHPAKKSYELTNKSLFTREWGDNVDDWNTQNSSSRVNRNWGEAAQLVQATHYANPVYPFTSYQTIYQAPPQLVGGCFWHSFDHQRGYHPDAFLGGFMDAFRQPKYSYEMFKSQRNPQTKSKQFETGYSLFIANEMTPFSSTDVTVYSNCDEVRLIVFEKDTLTLKSSRNQPDMPSPPFVFKNVYNYMQLKALHRAGKWKQASIVAEGIVNGKPIIRTVKMPAKRPDKIVLTIDHEKQTLKADGSDIMVIIASITDNEGNVRRLNTEKIKFEVTGEAVLVGDAGMFANPRQVEWGTAPALIRSTTKPGRIIIKASIAVEGNVLPQQAVIELTSVPALQPLLFSETGTTETGSKPVKVTEPADVQQLKLKLKKVEAELNELKRKQVEKDQELFEQKTSKGN